MLYFRHSQSLHTHTRTHTTPCLPLLRVSWQAETSAPVDVRPGDSIYRKDRILSRDLSDHNLPEAQPAVAIFEDRKAGPRRAVADDDDDDDACASSSAHHNRAKQPASELSAAAPMNTTVNNAQRPPLKKNVAEEMTINTRIAFQEMAELFADSPPPEEHDPEEGVAGSDVTTTQLTTNLSHQFPGDTPIPHQKASTPFQIHHDSLHGDENVNSCRRRKSNKSRSKREERVALLQPAVKQAQPASNRDLSFTVFCDENKSDTEDSRRAAAPAPRVEPEFNFFTDAEFENAAPVVARSGHGHNGVQRCSTTPPDASEDNFSFFTDSKFCDAAAPAPTRCTTPPLSAKSQFGMSSPDENKTPPLHKKTVGRGRNREQRNVNKVNPAAILGARQDVEVDEDAAPSPFFQHMSSVDTTETSSTNHDHSEAFGFGNDISNLHASRSSSSSSALSTLHSRPPVAKSRRNEYNGFEHAQAEFSVFEDLQDGSSSIIGVVKKSGRKNRRKTASPSALAGLLMDSSDDEDD